MFNNEKSISQSVYNAGSIIIQKNGNKIVLNALIIPMLVFSMNADIKSFILD